MASKVRDTDRGYAALLKRLRKAAAPTALTVGIHEAEGGESKGEGQTMLDVAVIHEFGAEEHGIPRRSFIRDWEDENHAEHQEQIRKVARAVVSGKVDSPEQGLERLGLRFQGEVQKRIAEGIDPPLAESTIARKGSSTPLVDTGQLRSSITYAVKKK